MIPLPSWMRRALFATAAMNAFAALAFLPGSTSLRALAGFPVTADPFYLLLAGLFIALFGLGYLWTALVGRGERLFIALAALGKLSFFILLVALWRAGNLPWRAPLLGSADLFFAAVFSAWLLQPTGRRPLADAERPVGSVRRANAGGS